MDGMFVPNISFGIPILKAVRPLTRKVLDVHLMIEKPERYIQAFKDAGADILTVHQEACVHLDRTLNAIRECGMKAGVSLNPATPVETLQHVLPLADLVLVMSVNPGFGGQKFIPYSLDKIRRLKHMIQEQGLPTLIEVDGGVTKENCASIAQAGAQVLVAGNTVFSAKRPQLVIAELQSLCNPSRTA
jgi:ribulose-phosphate 3-epimerase